MKAVGNLTEPRSSQSCCSITNPHKDSLRDVSPLGTWGDTLPLNKAKCSPMRGSSTQQIGVVFPLRSPVAHQPPQTQTHSQWMKFEMGSWEEDVCGHTDGETALKAPFYTQRSVSSLTAPGVDCLLGMNAHKGDPLISNPLGFWQNIKTSNRLGFWVWLELMLEVTPGVVLRGHTVTVTYLEATAHPPNTVKRSGPGGIYHIATVTWELF